MWLSKDAIPPRQELGHDEKSNSDCGSVDTFSLATTAKQAKKTDATESGHRVWARWGSERRNWFSITVPRR